MKLALELDGHQVNHVVIKSLRKSVQFCKSYDKPDSTKEVEELVWALQRVLKLYENAEHRPRWLARTKPDEGWPAFEKGSQ